MKRYATERLVAAVGLSLGGAIVAVLAGMAEVALFVAPWVVLAVLGFSRQDRVSVQLAVQLSEDRLLVGDSIELTTTAVATSDALLKVTPQPPASFWPVVAGGTPVAPSTVDAVRAGQSARITTMLQVDEWGAHDLGTTSFEVVAPHGLFAWRGAFAQRAMVRVHPQPTQLRELLAPWLVRRVSGTHRSRESAHGIEYADLREFTPGDSVRDINWRVSARTGDLWISQRHPDRATDVVLLVDSFVETGHDVRSVFGLVVESAVALAESHLAVTDRVGLVEFGGVVRWVGPGTGRVQLQKLTDALLATGLYANAADKELPILPPRALPPRSFVIAFTPLLDDRFVEAVFTARGRGHDVAVIECAASEADAVTSESESRQLTQRLWDAERTMLRDRMAEQGISVARWDGSEHLDLTLAGLLQLRRRGMRVGGR